MSGGATHQVATVNHFFFFQAEDGIRDADVTGVQTCALPIYRERAKLDKNLAGIKNLGRLPGALFVVDAKKERIAVAEANKLGIPVVAIVDTNADPDLITRPIPGNDDAIRAVSLITNAISDVIAEARHQMPLRDAATGEEGEGTTYSTETGEADVDGDRKKRPARRKRRPKPEAIAARMQTEEAPAPPEPS